MLDTFVAKVTQAPSYPQTVHEHRAPTDESVRLFMELRENAERSVIESLNSGDNDVKYSAVTLYDPIESQTIIGIKVSINGKKHFLRIPMKDRATLHRETASAVYAEIAEQIASELMKSIGHSLR